MKKIFKIFKIAIRAKANLPNFILLKFLSFFHNRLKFLHFSTVKFLIALPGKIYISPTFHCNFKCLFCLEHSPFDLECPSPYLKGDKFWERDYLFDRLDANLFRKVINDAYDLRLRRVGLSGGGEPLMHPDFIMMCGYIKSKGMMCSISTNAELLTNEIAKSLVDLGVDRINISLNAASAKTHMQIHNINRDVFLTILENLKFLLLYKKRNNQIKPVLKLSYVICKLNYFEVIPMIEIGIKLGVSQIGFWNMLYCKAREELMRPFLLTAQEAPELKGLLVEAQILAKNNGITTNIPSFLKKMQAPESNSFLVQQKDIYTCQIQADGVVYPYDFPYQVGNINKQNFIEICYSNKYIKFRKKILSLAKEKKRIPNYPFCRRCDIPLYKKELCTLKC